MTEIFAITVPIFIVIALGYLSIEFKIFQKLEIRTLGTFVLMFAMPALILRSFSQRTLSEVLDMNYLLAYTLGSFAVMLVGVAVMRLGFKASLQNSAITALGMAGSNSGFIGYPLVALVIGPVAGLALALNMLVENVLVIPLALALAESGMGTHQGFKAIMQGIASRLVRSPMIIAIAVGLAMSLLEVHLPTPVARTIDLMAMASGPVALFVIGATLHGLRLEGMGSNLGVIIAGKLVLHPLCIWAALELFPVQSRELTTAALLMAAVPMMGIYPLLGQRFGQDKLCAAALLGATVVSFVTLTAVLGLIRH